MTPSLGTRNLWLRSKPLARVLLLSDLHCFFIPEKFKGLIRIEPTSSRVVQDEREWRLAQDHRLSVTTNEKGEKEWGFLKGFESEGVFYSLVLPYESLEER